MYFSDSARRTVSRMKLTTPSCIVCTSGGVPSRVARFTVHSSNRVRARAFAGNRSNSRTFWMRSVHVFVQSQLATVAHASVASVRGACSSVYHHPGAGGSCAFFRVVIDYVHALNVSLLPWIGGLYLCAGQAIADARPINGFSYFEEGWKRVSRDASMALATLTQLFTPDSWSPSTPFDEFSGLRYVSGKVALLLNWSVFFSAMFCEVLLILLMSRENG